MIDPRTPILIGVGQVTDRWNGDAMADAPSPLKLAVTASRAALADTGQVAAVRAQVDHIFYVQTFLDFDRSIRQPFGRCGNPPGTLARDMGIEAARLVYSVSGGDQPQALVNEAAEAIFNGDARAVLIAGGEATAAMKLALKRCMALDWSDCVEGDFEDCGFGPMLLSPYELTNGFGMPTQTYPAFEHALRRRWGRSIDQHHHEMANLWAGFSAVAAANPYAQFPVARTPEFLKTPSAENYPVADPYLKWHVAQDAVNQGAAVVMTSVGRAQATGIDPGKWIYLHGYAEALDKTPLARPDLGRSQAIELALNHALAASGRASKDIAHFDLYSCFPCAVLIAAEALGLDWRKNMPTVTGGLPFFGGPGNNYSLHAIASMVERLRQNPDDFGLVLANGGFLSKQAVGIYRAVEPQSWAPVSSRPIQRMIDETPEPLLLSCDTTATVISYSVFYKSGSARQAYVIADTSDGRLLARSRPDDTTIISALQSGDPIGQQVEIRNDRGVNFVQAINGLP